MRDRERKPRDHPAREALDRGVHVPLELGELRDRVHPLRDRLRAEPERRREQGDVLATGELGVEPCPTASSGSTRPQTRISPLVGSVVPARI